MISAEETQAAFAQQQQAFAQLNAESYAMSSQMGTPAMSINDMFTTAGGLPSSMSSGGYGTLGGQVMGAGRSTIGAVGFALPFMGMVAPSLRFMDPFTGSLGIGASAARGAMPLKYAEIARSQGIRAGYGAMKAAGLPMGTVIARGIGGLAMGAALYGAGSAAASYTLDHVMQGAEQRTAIGTFLDTAVGGGLMPNFQGGPGAALSISNFMRNQVYDINQGSLARGGVLMGGGGTTNFGEMMGLVGQAAELGHFQGTRTVQEFQKKTKDLLREVQGIVQVLNTTKEEALGLMSHSMGQGFVGAGSAQAHVLAMGGLAAQAGMGIGDMAQLGAAGAQTFRGFGGIGAMGAITAQQAGADLGTAARMGILGRGRLQDITGMSGAQGVQALAARWTAQARQVLGTREGGKVLEALIDPTTGQIDQGLAAQYRSGLLSASDIDALSRDKRGSTTVRQAIRARSGSLASSLISQVGAAPLLGRFAMSEAAQAGGSYDEQSAVMQRITGFGEQEVELLREMTGRMGELKGEATAEFRSAMQKGMASRMGRTDLSWSNIKTALKHKILGSWSRKIEEFGAGVQDHITQWVTEAVQGVSDYQVGTIPGYIQDATHAVGMGNLEEANRIMGFQVYGGDGAGESGSPSMTIGGVALGDLEMRQRPTSLFSGGPSAMRGALGVPVMRAGGWAVAGLGKIGWDLGVGFGKGRGAQLATRTLMRAGLSPTQAAAVLANPAGSGATTAAGQRALDRALRYNRVGTFGGRLATSVGRLGGGALRGAGWLAKRSGLLYAGYLGARMAVEGTGPISGELFGSHVAGEGVSPEDAAPWRAYAGELEPVYGERGVQIDTPGENSWTLWKNRIGRPLPLFGGLLTDDPTAGIMPLPGLRERRAADGNYGYAYDIGGLSGGAGFDYARTGEVASVLANIQTARMSPQAALEEALGAGGDLSKTIEKLQSPGARAQYLAAYYGSAGDDVERVRLGMQALTRHVGIDTGANKMSTAQRIRAEVSVGSLAFPHGGGGLEDKHLARLSKVFKGKKLTLESAIRDQYGLAVREMIGATQDAPGGTSPEFGPLRALHRWARGTDEYWEDKDIDPLTDEMYAVFRGGHEKDLRYALTAAMYEMGEDGKGAISPEATTRLHEVASRSKLGIAALIAASTGNSETLRKILKSVAGPTYDAAVQDLGLAFEERKKQVLAAQSQQGEGSTYSKMMQMAGGTKAMKLQQDWLKSYLGTSMDLGSAGRSDIENEFLKLIGQRGMSEEELSVFSLLSEQESVKGLATLATRYGYYSRNVVGKKKKEAVSGAGTLLDELRGTAGMAMLRDTFGTDLSDVGKYGTGLFRAGIAGAMRERLGETESANIDRYSDILTRIRLGRGYTEDEARDLSVYFAKHGLAGANSVSGEVVHGVDALTQVTDAFTSKMTTLVGLVEQAIARSGGGKDSPEVTPHTSPAAAPEREIPRGVR